MSQNLSTKPEIYMPELIKLDSYWQKAVEDATLDTLKSKKRLNLALKNQYKINQKLEKLGLKTSKSQIHTPRTRKVKDLSEDDLFRVRSSTKEWESERCESVISLLSILDDEDYMTNEQRTAHEETPPKKKYQIPDKPIIGNGSLEKMKRSQNSFNCEPMGMKDSIAVFLQDQGIENVAHERNKKNKSVGWLHIRRGSAFRDSISDFCGRGVAKEVVRNNGFKKHATVKDRNYFLDPSIKIRMHTSGEGRSETYTSAKSTSSKTSRDQKIKESEQRLSLALAKRDIVSKHLKALKMDDSSQALEIDETHVKNTKKFRKNQKHLPPFTKLYLEVYRELCHKVPIKHIMREAVKRWHRRSKN